MKEPNAMSFHVKYKPEDFMPANEEEKQSQVIMRESVGFWQDGFRRLRKNKVAMVSLFVIIVVMIFSFIVPAFYPYDYKTQIKGSENLHPMQYSEKEIERMDAGEKVFPHVLGTDKMGRDYAIRVMMGSRISLLVGLIATAIIFVIGSLIGSISAFFGGWVDLIIMRIVDIIYTIPDFLLIVLAHNDEPGKQEHQYYCADAVILATGGIGRVYDYTTNSAIATGDGIQLAYNLGASNT